MVTEEQRELMRKHLDLVIEYNKATNLTRIDSSEEGELLHIEDSLTALDEIKAAPEGKLADIGTVPVIFNYSDTIGYSIDRTDPSTSTTLAEN